MDCSYYWNQLLKRRKKFKEKEWTVCQKCQATTEHLKSVLKLKDTSKLLKLILIIINKNFY